MTKSVQGGLEKDPFLGNRHACSNEQQQDVGKTSFPFRFEDGFDRLCSQGKSNGVTVEQAAKKAFRENYTCVRNGNQQKLDHELQVLDKLDDATNALKSSSYGES